MLNDFLAFPYHTILNGENKIQIMVRTNTKGQSFICKIHKSENQDPETQTANMRDSFQSTTQEHINMKDIIKTL